MEVGAGEGKAGREGREGNPGVKGQKERDTMFGQEEDRGEGRLAVFSAAREKV